MNHHQIFPLAGIPVSTYPYYDPQTIGLAFGPFLETLKSAAPRSVFLLHACAHNPTGVDPTREQWAQIADVMLEKGHFAFFDCAYQGFASGDLDNDAWAVREFVRRDVPLLICQVRHTHSLREIAQKRAHIMHWGGRARAELREERRSVWGACRSAACRIPFEGGCGPDQEPAVGFGSV